MPMIWSAEADAKLMATIIQKCDVKLSGAQLQEIAKIMGPGCSAKAISHRMTLWRKNGGQGAGAAAKSKFSGKVTKAAGEGKKLAAGRIGTPTDEEDDLPALAASRPKRGGAKRDYAHMAGGDDVDVDGRDSEDLDKKVKLEVDEEKGGALV